LHSINKENNKKEKRGLKKEKIFTFSKENEDLRIKNTS